MPDFHILLVEDDENDIFFVERAIRDIRGLSLYVLRDGQEAIKYLRGDPPFDQRAKFPLPNLILLDLKMPKTGGCSPLKKSEACRFRQKGRMARRDD
jgi:CheY-like chemotaxis protein